MHENPRCIYIRKLDSDPELMNRKILIWRWLIMRKHEIPLIWLLRVFKELRDMDLQISGVLGRFGECRSWERWDVHLLWMDELHIDENSKMVMYNNGITVLDAIVTDGTILTVLITIVKFGSFRNTITEDWVHMKREIIRWITTVSKFCFYSTVEGRFPNVWR